MRDFMMAALPLVVGIALAVFFAGLAEKKKKQEKKTAMRPLAYILLSNLFNVIRMNMDKK